MRARKERNSSNGTVIKLSFTFVPSVPFVASAQVTQKLVLTLARLRLSDRCEVKVGNIVPTFISLLVLIVALLVCKISSKFVGLVFLMYSTN